MLKQLFKAKKKTQEGFARKYNISQSLISQWCNGTCEPSVGLIEPLSEYLDVDVLTIVRCFPKKKKAA